MRGVLQPSRAGVKRAREGSGDSEPTGLLILIGVYSLYSVVLVPHLLSSAYFSHLFICLCQVLVAACGI